MVKGLRSEDFTYRSNFFDVELISWRSTDSGQRLLHGGRERGQTIDYIWIGLPSSATENESSSNEFSSSVNYKDKSEIVVFLIHRIIETTLSFPLRPSTARARGHFLNFAANRSLTHAGPQPQGLHWRDFLVPPERWDSDRGTEWVRIKIVYTYPKPSPARKRYDLSRRTANVGYIQRVGVNGIWYAEAESEV